MSSSALKITMKAQLLMIAAVSLSFAADNVEEPASKKDLDGLQGSWNLVSAMQDGKALPGDEVKQTTIVISGDTFRFPGLAKDATSRAGTFKLDATKDPKEMDTISAEKEIKLGIYELDGDRYKVCFAPAGKPRPNEFASKPGSGSLLQVW